MNRMRQLLSCALVYQCVLAFAVLFAAQPANAQEMFTGTVVSASRTTVTVRADDGRHQLFTFARDSVIPQTLPIGSRVRVTSTPSDDAGIRLASEITVLPAGEGGGAPQAGAVVPDEVRDLEREIERAAKRFQVGVRGGFALDPELIEVG